MIFFSQLYVYYNESIRRICDFMISVVANAAEYYGKFIGPLKSYHHGLGGYVYAVDARTLHIRDFAYDGEGPGNRHYNESFYNELRFIYLLNNK